MGNDPGREAGRDMQEDVRSGSPPGVPASASSSAGDRRQMSDIQRPADLTNPTQMAKVPPTSLPLAGVTQWSGKLNLFIYTLFTYSFYLSH